MRGDRRVGQRLLWWLAIGLAVLLAACSGQNLPQVTGASTEAAGVTVSAPVVQIAPSATAVMVTPKPQVGAPIAPPVLPTAVATVTPTPAQATAVLEPLASPSPTEPPPTYTPPPPPPPVPGEHLIFGRPVPAGSTQWTDKAYPYGSTRGGTLQPHHGVEFAVPVGTPVLAVASGTVRFAGPDDVVAVGPQTNFYGNAVVIEHDATPNGVPVLTLYGHLSEVGVSVGDRVDAGQQIGLSGDTGIAYGPHVHFEVREGANSYVSTRNPLLWLRPFSADGIVAGLVTFANGQPAHEVPITLSRVDGAAPYTATTSYADAPVNADAALGENFAMDDVLAGYYEITVGTGPDVARQFLWVFPGRTNLVTLALP